MLAYRQQLVRTRAPSTDQPGNRLAKGAAGRDSRHMDLNMKLRGHRDSSGSGLLGTYCVPALPPADLYGERKFLIFRLKDTEPLGRIASRRET